MTRQRSKGKLFSSHIPTGPSSESEDPRSPDLRNNSYSSSSLKFTSPIENERQKGEESRPGRDRSTPEGLKFLDPRIDSTNRAGKNILLGRDLKQELVGREKTKSEKNMDVTSDIIGTRIGESKRAILIEHENWRWRWAQGSDQNLIQGPGQGLGQRGQHFENQKDVKKENENDSKNENGNENENENDWLSGVTELSVRHMSVPAMLSEVTRYSSQLPSLTSLQLVDNNITSLNQVRCYHNRRGCEQEPVPSSSLE